MFNPPSSSPDVGTPFFLRPTDVKSTLLHSTPPLLHSRCCIHPRYSSSTPDVETPPPVSIPGVSPSLPLIHLSNPPPLFQMLKPPTSWTPDVVLPCSSTDVQSILFHGDKSTPSTTDVPLLQMFNPLPFSIPDDESIIQRLGLLFLFRC